MTINIKGKSERGKERAGGRREGERISKRNLIGYPSSDESEDGAEKIMRMSLDRGQIR
jgi:hypothetical protein